MASAKNKAENIESRPYTIDQFKNYFERRSEKRERSVSFDENFILSTSSKSTILLKK